MKEDLEKEDIEASEDANVAFLERQFSRLTIAMTGLGDSDAWRDFVDGAREMLGIDSEWRKVSVPKDFWDYWIAVAAGQSPDYDTAGRRLIGD